VPQSLAQLDAVSPVSQVPLPHTGVALPQSLLQLVLVSPLSHLPLPQTGPVPAHGSGHCFWLEQVTMLTAAEFVSMPMPHSCMQLWLQSHITAQLKKPLHFASFIHAAHWLLQPLTAQVIEDAYCVLQSSGQFVDSPASHLAAVVLQSPGQLVVVSPDSQVPLPHLGPVWQSCGHISISLPSHFLSPQTGPVALQSLAQLALVSPLSQVPLPQTGPVVLQSWLQLAEVSPVSHLLLPHTGSGCDVGMQPFCIIHIPSAMPALLPSGMSGQASAHASVVHFSKQLAEGPQPASALQAENSDRQLVLTHCTD
jgi:hypothetical protein